MLREIVVHNENILALFHEIFSRRACAVRRKILHGGAVGCTGCNNKSIAVRSGCPYLVYNMSNGGCLLTDRTVNTDNSRIFLIHNRLKGYRCFSGLTVSDYKLALTAPDRNHTFYGDYSRLERHVYAVSVNQRRCAALNGEKFF